MIVYPLLFGFHRFAFDFGRKAVAPTFLAGSSLRHLAYELKRPLLRTLIPAIVIILLSTTRPHHHHHSLVMGAFFVSVPRAF
jgi:hypothetical protein